MAKERQRERLSDAHAHFQQQRASAVAEAAATAADTPLEQLPADPVAASGTLPIGGAGAAAAPAAPADDGRGAGGTPQDATAKVSTAMVARSHSGRDWVRAAVGCLRCHACAGAAYQCGWMNAHAGVAAPSPSVA